jgi:hypothetical protein
VPMLFILPARVVPLVVAAGLVVAALPEVLRGTLSLDRAAVLPANALFAFGPATVFLAAGEPQADWHGGLVLAVAVAAPFAFDFAAACSLGWLAHAVSPRDLLRPLAPTFAIDALVAPFAYGIAVAERVQEASLLLPIPLVALLTLFAHERRGHVDSLLELSAAYRGTALLLGDVIEADDAYTGEHSRKVVDLVVAVCERIGLDPRERGVRSPAARVGKIRMPAQLLGKSGPLDPRERALIEMHTIEGERLLERVGGLLAEVRADRALVPRALGSRRLSRRARGRRDPGRRAGRLVLRRVRRHDYRRPLSPRARPRRRGRGVAREPGHAVRPGSSTPSSRSSPRRLASGCSTGRSGRRRRCTPSRCRSASAAPGT